MQLPAGSRLGSYEILTRLGAGGMGEVFKARDTRLDRIVAIKVLSAEFADDDQQKRRFEREAKTISQLNHPHICTLHDVGHDNGVSYLVMELVDGETLADRIARGPLPLPSVLRYGSEIASALDGAHRAGIVHRDLKPANIMITKSGAKLLDFGLARSATLDVVADGDTQRMPLTREGTILGTFQYMAPEQLNGQQADPRTDIFALGNVLYEMATGRRAFEGKSKTSLIAAIVEHDPPSISQVQPLTPPALEHIIHQCLEKDPDARWQSAFDVAEELRWVATASQATQPSGGAATRTLIIALALALGLAAAALLYTFRSRGPAPRQPDIRVPLVIEGAGAISSMAVSEDGRMLAFVADTEEGQRLLWIRPLNATQATPIERTDGAQYPFWSPDSRYVGFFADGRLKKVDVVGGAPQTLCNVRNSRGGSWSRQGVIVFAPTGSGGLLQIPAGGGTPVSATELRKGASISTHRWPMFLPDGRRFLYLATTFGTALDRSEFGIYAADPETKLEKRILAVNSNFAYAAGHLLYVREGTLYAHRFDDDRLELKGDPVPLAPGVSYTRTVSGAEFAAAGGILVYQSGPSRERTQIVRFDRAGALVERLSDAGRVMNPNVAPDGRRLALEVAEDGSTNSDIWVFGGRSPIGQRLTFSPAEDSNPIWSRDGTWIAYNTYDGSQQVIVRSDASGGGDPVVLHRQGSSMMPNDASPDGKWVVFQHYTEGGREDLMLVPADGKGEGRALAATPAAEYAAQISPDGRWLAFTSDESGRPEVYLTPFPAAQSKWQASAGGGSEPRWRGDGKELFHLDRNKRIVATTIGGGDVPEFGAPQVLFRPAVRHVISGTDTWSYDAAPDGDSFVVNVRDPGAAQLQTTLWVNWDQDRAGELPDGTK